MRESPDSSPSSLSAALQTMKSSRTNLKHISFHQSDSGPSTHQLNADSLTISFTRTTKDNQCFTELLGELAVQKTSYSQLTNLAFHGIEWDSNQLRNLRLLLDRNTSIKHLEFRRTTLGPEGISELSKVLETNKAVRALTLSECRIGPHGASSLASALSYNDTLEELQIWEDSIGSRGAEDLSQMIETNTSLKVLVIFDTDLITAEPLISAVLARNRATEVHVWAGGSHAARTSSKVVEFGPETNTLRIYKMGNSGSVRVASALASNTTVRSLDMTGVRLRTSWARQFRVVLEENRCLRVVNLSRTCLKDKAAVYIAAGLFRNQHLDTLILNSIVMTGIGIEHLLCPLSRFSPFQSQANTTLRSLAFGGPRTRVGRRGLAAIITMLETNQTLVELQICEDSSMGQVDLVRVFKALERNATLERLSLRDCRGVRGEVVLKAIMGTLQVNPWIREVNLAGTPLQVTGMADPVYEKLRQNGAISEEKDVVSELPLAMPMSCRIFVCGQEFAGKETLCSSIDRNMNPTRPLRYTNHLRTILNPLEPNTRRDTITIKTIRDGDTRMSLWKFPGTQYEGFSLHDLMFPDPRSPSSFVVASSLFRKPENKARKAPEEIEADLLYWLKFIVSNSKRATAPQSGLPHVTVVLTHCDKVSQQVEDLRPIASTVHRLRDRFRGFAEIYPTVFMVDARSNLSVSSLTHHLRKTARTILRRAPQVYQLSEDMVELLKHWRMENLDRPVMRWDEFCELCQLRVPTLRVRSRHGVERVEKRRNAVAVSMHRAGDVVYFEGLGFLVLDCQWFFDELLRLLIGMDAAMASTDERKGFVGKTEFEKAVRASVSSGKGSQFGSVFGDDSSEGSVLVKMMLRLGICYEQDPGDPQTLLLIPALLSEEKGRSEGWEMSSTDYRFVGRRLVYDNEHMFLTAGFFPRLQVLLYNKILRSENPQGARYSLARNLISLTVNGVHLRIEIESQLSHHIDILACSAKTIGEMLKLFQHLIVPAVHSLFPTITFSENVIRSDCVKRLTPMMLRRTQTVPLQQLKQALLSVPADGMYDYQHTWSPVTVSSNTILSPGFDYARDLLSEDEFREVLQRRYCDLNDLATELSVPTENTHAEADTSHAGVEPSLTGIARALELVLQRLKDIEQEVRDLKQEVRGLRYYEHCLLVELNKRVEYLLNYSVHVEERKAPNMFYLVESRGDSRRLVTRLFPGMSSLRLHMLCEYRGEMHVVEDQLGCEVVRIESQAVRCLLPYMTGLMKLLTIALKIGAHVVAGMGELIPDLAREVARLVDGSLVHGAEALVATGAIGTAAVMRQIAGNKYRGSRSRNTAEEMRVAQQWLLDFLSAQKISTGKDIAERFGLWRVRYRNDGRVAWVCRRHLLMKGHEIAEMPV